MLRALSEYYDCLCRQRDSGLLPDGYSSVGVSCNLVLNPDGTIHEILPYVNTVISGKKTKEVPRNERFPFRNSVPGIAAETIEHREKYLFGIEWDKQEERLTATKHSLLAFTKCKEKNLAFLDGLSSPVIDAFKSFLQNWIPENETENLLLTAMGKKYGGAKFVVTSKEDASEQGTLNRDPLIKEKWENFLSSRTIPDDAVTGQCSISGKFGPIARIHNNLFVPGIPNGLATGMNIVCLKSSAFWSYDRKEAYNSSVSQEVMEKYTKAFNYLTSTPNHKQMLDDMALLSWAMTKESEKPYLQAFNFGLFSVKPEDPAEEERGEREKQEEALASIFRQLAQGEEADWKSFNIDTNIEFYLLGVKANSSRLAIKIFEHNKFGSMMDNIGLHHRDMRLFPADKQIPVWRIGEALKSPISARDPLPPDLSTKILQSILRASPYPRFMLDTAVRRAKTDQDDAGKKFQAVSRDRVRIIKACLTRRNLIKRGELNMLNTQNQDSAYNCGRLFAVLEMIQQKALPGINTTIKDRFFSAACSTPYLVFPRLMKLAQSHLGKLDKGSVVFYEKHIQEISNNLGDSFPKALNMEKQGMFILGYYQQREKIFEKSDRGEKDNELA